MLIGQTLAHNARVKADREALVFEGRCLTWRMLNEGANRIANAIAALGASHGDRVLLLMPNSVEFVETYYGLAKLGCISAPVAPGLVPSEIAFIARKLGVRVAVVHAEAADLLRSIIDEIPTLEHVIGCQDGHGMPLDFEELKAAASPDEPDASVEPDDDLTVKFTSGTTGSPKGCVRSHRNFIMSSTIALIEVPLHDEEVALLAQPLAAGMAISFLTIYVLKGIKTVMMPKFEPGSFLEAIEQHRPTHVTSMDWMLRRMTNHPDFAHRDLSSIRILHGINQMESLEGLLRQGTFQGSMTAGYASSEAGGVLTYKKPRDFAIALADPTSPIARSCGKEGALVRIECVDDAQKPLPPGEIGEIAIKSPTVFRGYWGQPEETAKVLKDGWMLTGDLGEKDEDGYLYLRGRKRDVIKTGGMNVYPAEIEPHILSHPAVADVAVIGLADPDWGERVVACVIASQPCTEAEILSHCRGKLAAHKRPKNVVFFDAFPTNASGKIVKKDLAQQLACHDPADLS